METAVKGFSLYSYKEHEAHDNNAIRSIFN